MGILAGTTADNSDDGSEELDVCGASSGGASGNLAIVNSKINGPEIIATILAIMPKRGPN